MKTDDIEALLQRIHYDGPRDPTPGTLQALHEAFLLRVVFENLDVQLGVEIRLDEGAFFDKVVHRGRGGFCYELNGLFAALLQGLGFEVSLHSARVHKEGGLTPEFDHLVLLVSLDEPWLADVGFGDFSRRPLRLSDPDTQHDGQADFRVTRTDDLVTTWQSRPGEPEQPRYSFGLRPRSLAEFAGMCVHNQTSPESHFTQAPLCSRATPEGRITLSGLRRIETRGDRPLEHVIAAPALWLDLLRDDFDIALPPDQAELLVDILSRI